MITLLEATTSFDPDTFHGIATGLLRGICNVAIVAGVLGIFASFVLIIARSPKGPRK